MREKVTRDRLQALSMSSTPMNTTTLLRRVSGLTRNVMTRNDI
mgnify:CR=1 FL=1